jgi:CPA2 family monovalent cation:H+ antiporter-2
MDYISRQIRNKKSIESKFDNIEQLETDQDLVLVAGLGRVGRRVVKTLNMANISYIALDNNPGQVVDAKKLGLNVFYGNALRAEVLRAAGINNKSILVITFRQKKEVERLIKIMLEHYPATPIFVRARDREDSEELRKIGADIAISEVLEAGLELGGAVLKTRGMDEDEIYDLLQDARQDYYSQVVEIDKQA